MTRVLREDAPALAQASLRESPVDDRRPLAADLEADHADAGFDREALEQEASSARANLELHQTLPTRHDRAWIEGFTLRQARGIGVGTNLHV